MFAASRFASGTCASNELQPLIDSCFNASDMESIFRNLSKSDNPWHGEILDTLKQKISLKFKNNTVQLQKAASMTMAIVSKWIIAW